MADLDALEQAAYVIADGGCGAVMDSQAVPGHTHVCTGAHDDGDHLCTACQRYFWSKEMNDGTAPHV